jgi:hypothetical protein
MVRVAWTEGGDEGAVELEPDAVSAFVDSLEHRPNLDAGSVQVGERRKPAATTSTVKKNTAKKRTTTVRRQAPAKKGRG